MATIVDPDPTIAHQSVRLLTFLSTRYRMLSFIGFLLFLAQAFVVWWALVNGQWLIILLFLGTYNFLLFWMFIGMCILWVKVDHATQKFAIIERVIIPAGPEDE